MAGTGEDEGGDGVEGASVSTDVADPVVSVHVVGQGVSYIYKGVQGAATTSNGGATPTRSWDPVASHHSPGCHLMHPDLPRAAPCGVPHWVPTCTVHVYGTGSAAPDGCETEAPARLCAVLRYAERAVL